ncbi:MAG TPA: MFS transporter, partial [Devosia sp.]|nr:MFS transporter [Devosia sp.]
MSLWFVSAAMLLYMVREVGMSPLRQAALSSGVQGGFVIGAVLSALFGLADRFDPRRLFAFSAVSAGLINLSLVSVVPGSAPAIAARVLTGLLLAGVYPLGMKIAVGWGDRDRGFLVGALVGALTLGSAPPHLMALGGGTDWRLTVTIASAGAIVAGLLCLRVGLGPFHAAAAAFNPRVISTAWKDHRIRLAYVGYLGHMWELYAMWAWVGAAAAASCGISLGDARAQWLARLTAFVVIGAGGSSCALSGWVADRIGKAEVTIIAMVVSGLSALATAPTF